MQDESLHYGIIQGWTKPVRSAGLYAIPGSLPVAQVLVSWPGQCPVWGFPCPLPDILYIPEGIQVYLGGFCAADYSEFSPSVLSQLTH